MLELLDHRVVDGGVDQLAGKPHVVERLDSIFGNEGAGCSPVLPQHHVGLVGRPIVVIGVQCTGSFDLVERGLHVADVEVVECVVEHPLAREAFDPLGRFHHVSVGVVDDSIFYVGH